MNMILTIGNTKGGVGKTTIAVQVAASLARAGKAVWLVDGDRQGTALTAITLRSEAGKTPPIACSQYFDGPKLRSQIMNQAGKWDDVVIDVGGQDSASMRAASSAEGANQGRLSVMKFRVKPMSDLARSVSRGNSACSSTMLS